MQNKIRLISNTTVGSGLQFSTVFKIRRLRKHLFLVLFERESLALGLVCIEIETILILSQSENWCGWTNV